MKKQTHYTSLISFIWIHFWKSTDFTKYYVKIFSWKNSKFLFWTQKLYSSSLIIIISAMQRLTESNIKVYSVQNISIDSIFLCAYSTHAK